MDTRVAEIKNVIKKELPLFADKISYTSKKDGSIELSFEGQSIKLEDSLMNLDVQVEFITKTINMLTGVKREEYEINIAKILAKLEEIRPGFPQEAGIDWVKERAEARKEAHKSFSKITGIDADLEIAQVIIDDYKEKKAH